MTANATAEATRVLLQAQAAQYRSLALALGFTEPMSAADTVKAEQVLKLIWMDTLRSQNASTELLVGFKTPALSVAQSLSASASA